MGNDPLNNKTFGGVLFNWNEVKSANVKKVQGQKMYFIEFKSGVKVQYPKQRENENNNPEMRSKELTMWQSLDYDTETFLNNVEHVKVSGTPKDDHIIGKSIIYSEINVSGDYNDDHVDIVSEKAYEDIEGRSHLERADIEGKRGLWRDFDKSHESHDNRLILGKDDTATKIDRNVIFNNIGKFTEERKLSTTEGLGIDNTF